jgi:hypothetical protein
LGSDAAREKERGSSERPVMPGSEQWMHIPAAALAGTPSVEMGGTLKIAILQGDPAWFTSNSNCRIHSAASISEDIKGQRI